MMRPRLPGPRSRAMGVAVITLAAALLLTGWSAMAALGGDDDTVSAPRDVFHVPPGLTASPTPSHPVLDDDPFSPDRQPPATRYRLPGSEEEVVEAPPKPVLPEVLGTVIATDGNNMATIRLGADSTKILRVGQSIGAFTVDSIAREQVTFTGASGERIVVRVKSPFPRS